MMQRMAFVGMCSFLLALAAGVRLEFLHSRAKHLAEEYGLFHEPVEILIPLVSVPQILLSRQNVGALTPSYSRMDVVSTA